MPGSGKTTLGKQLAESLNVPFVDLDKEIEGKERRSVRDIFLSLGEDHFRKTEAETLREWASSSGSFVMATGGGTPCYYNGIHTINQAGLSFFIDVDIDLLLQRLQDNTDRPLLHDINDRREKLTSLRENRLSYYKKAHLTLNHPSVSDLLHAIRART